MKIGLNIIGNEILSGRRRDCHLDNVISLLAPRNLRLSWVTVLPDDADVLARHFKASIARGEFVLNAGGIGGTPDDVTRHGIAKASSLELVVHPQALPVLQRKFGDALTPERLRMIEFPQGATLIPNPVNDIPGFSVTSHHFVPGFPDMARPMFAWVLDQYYQPNGRSDLLELALKVEDCPESKLIPVMERLLETYDGIKVFSLPNISSSGRYVELGVYGDSGVVKEAFNELQFVLNTMDIRWQALEPVS